jgi:SAM-dependent methyltransferase
MSRMLLDLRKLENSPTVANGRMNREREIRGTNSYAADLGFDVIQFLVERLERREAVAWLDLCCGSGRALIQAAECLRELGMAGRVILLGVDLVDMFAAVPEGIGNLTLTAASAHEWRPSQEFDLITCVHGLHYVGDKLDLIARAASWLRPEGVFAGHLDLGNVKLVGHKSANARVGKEFKRLGLEYDRRRHIVSCHGCRRIEFPFCYVGADDEAGPNFTRQPAVDSYYQSSRETRILGTRKSQASEGEPC